MPIVALTGGVAAGKSTVTRVLEECGATVVDADLLARDAVAAGSPALQAIAERFGSGVIDPSGSLNRRALGDLVFSNDDARRDLEGIVHPVVQALSRERFRSAQRDDPQRVLVYAIPLLAEARTRSEFDLVVLVETPAAQRIERLVEHRDLSLAEATQRVEAQVSDSERRVFADVVLDSSDSVATTERRARELYAALSACWPDRLSEVSGLLDAQQS
jgi:dephospho-CoA kinase